LSDTSHFTEDRMGPHCIHLVFIHLVFIRLMVVLVG